MLWIRAVSARLWCSSWWIRSRGCKGEAFKGVLGREISDEDGDKDLFLRECRHHSDTGGKRVGDGSRPSSGTTVVREARNSQVVDKLRASELERRIAPSLLTLDQPPTAATSNCPRADHSHSTEIRETDRQWNQRVPTINDIHRPNAAENPLPQRILVSSCSNLI